MIEYYCTCPSSPKGKDESTRRATFSSPSRYSSPNRYSPRKRFPSLFNSTARTTPKEQSKSVSPQRFISRSAHGVRKTLAIVPDLLSLSSHSMRGGSNHSSSHRRRFGASPRKMLYHDWDSDASDSSDCSEDEFCLLGLPSVPQSDKKDDSPVKIKEPRSPQKETKEANVLDQLEQQARELSLMIESKLVHYRESSSKSYELAEARFSAGSPRVSVLVPLRNHAQAERGVAQWENFQRKLQTVKGLWQSKLIQAEHRRLPATMGLDSDGQSRIALLQLQKRVLRARNGGLSRQQEEDEEYDYDNPCRKSVLTPEELFAQLEASLVNWERMQTKRAS